MDIDIKDLIKEAIENIDVSSLVRIEIRELITQQVQKLIDQKASSLIIGEIQNVLNGKVKTDDGWGKKFEYDSFADLFKKKLLEKMNDSWDIKRNIESIIKSRVDDLFKNEYKSTANFMADRLLKSVTEAIK